ncbi:ABC-2 type transport system ATP-binding protein [Pseudoduganella lurida]|uniref:ABC-2 type transport system ATP-binding protein n=1 Tax=Pseudoduganella lurida TaxID=1036180 RepID=A0A562RM92_9BURK|nr:ABC transporter ATP-binding protein [Pseudoduganella lurida]TWI70003.1 ABC-2 type transport system ATP-binding protein [Pseudoduganella lurida]
MIRIEQLVKRYGDRTAVDHLNLHVAAGEVYALLGPNGAGKSTTIGCLLGFVPPDGGTITLAGSPLPPAAAAVKHAAYIAENVALYDRLTGVENVEFFMRLLGQKPSRERIETLLERAGLPAHAWHRLAQGYSKGMRQKVGIVMALAKGAQVLVLDEPTSGLDPEASVSFGTLIRSLADDGAAVLMATHDLFRAQELADRCGMLVGGHLISEWNLGELNAGELERNYLDTLASRV